MLKFVEHPPRNEPEAPSAAEGRIDSVTVSNVRPAILDETLCVRHAIVPRSNHSVALAASHLVRSLERRAFQAVRDAEVDRLRRSEEHTSELQSRGHLV